MSTAEPHLLSSWAWLFIRSLTDGGLTDVILSPGSRSTPLTHAALESELTCHSVVDERSAAHLAVGHAKMTGRPCAVVCTSGSAAANYLPAVVEAAQSHSPLLLITADRPAELTQCDAPQTIDQNKLYGDFVRAFFDLGAPQSSPAALRALRRKAVQALALCRHPIAGPVHINFPAAKPLEPSADFKQSTLFGQVRQVAEQPATQTFVPTATADPAAVEFVVNAVRHAERGLICLGPRAPHRAIASDALSAFARASGFPLFCEATSQARFGRRKTEGVTYLDAFDLIYWDVPRKSEALPDLIVQLGATPTSAAYAQLTERPETTHIVISDQGWQDPSNAAAAVIAADPTSLLGAVTEQLSKNPKPGQERLNQLLCKLNRSANQGVAEVLERLEFSEGLAVRTVVEQLEDASLLAVGNSLPVREIDTYVDPGAVQAGVRVWSQRGANGIDGVVSGALGAALAHSGPTTLLIGDLSYLHDLGGLMAMSQLSLKHPLTVVVLNNGGGRIFEQLPVRALYQDRPGFEYWTTPHHADLVGLARSFGLNACRVKSQADLRAALQAARGERAPSVVEVHIPAHGPSVQEQALKDHVTRRLAPIHQEFGG